MVITRAIQDIIPMVTEDLTMDMVIHTGMGLRIDTGIIIDTVIIMAGIIMAGIIVVNLWNLPQRTFILVYGYNMQ